jgi:hypothetical protein
MGEVMQASSLDGVNRIVYKREERDSIPSLLPGGKLPGAQRNVCGGRRGSI